MTMMNVRREQEVWVSFQSPHICQHFFFYKVQADTIRNFPLVFGDQEEDRVEKPDERTDREKLTDLIDFYYNTFMVIAGEDPLKMKQAQEINVQEALFYLSYMVKKNKKLEAQYKKQKV